MSFDALILAGGAARRMGGVDKPALVVDGTTMLDRVLLACADASARVVVGPERETVVPVCWVAEDVPFGGPVAGLAAGLEAVTASRVVLLAADLPFLDQATVAPLAAGADSGLVLVADGREQWLCSAWPTVALRAALVGQLTHGAALRTILGGLGPRRLEVSRTGLSPWSDVDTPADLARARAGNAQRSVA